MVAPVSVIVVDEAGALTTPFVHVVDADGVCAITKPEGRVSVRDACVNGSVFEFVNAMTNGAVAPTDRDALPVVKPAGFPLSNVKPPMALLMVRGAFTCKISVVG